MGETLKVGEADHEGVAVELGLALNVPVAVAVALGLADAVLVPLGEPVDVKVALEDGVML